MNILKKTPIFLSFLTMCLFAFCFCSVANDPGEDDEKIKKIIQNVRQSLSFLHYNPQAINDDFSKQVFDNYIEFIDPNKRYLLQSDVDFFKNDLYNLDDYFNENKLEFYHTTVDTIFQRIADAEKISEELLEHPFDFEKYETLSLDSEKRSFAKNAEELKNQWRKYLKYNTLTEIAELEEDSTNAGKSFAELEKEAREQVQEYTHDFFRRLKKRKRSNYLSGYINSFTSIYDPHTVYYSPKDKKDFDQHMSGQLQGIGARLQDQKGYATITELIVGGPAWSSKQLEVDDQIIKVQQEDEEEAVNIVGMLLEESIELIKGKKGTEVTLTVKKKSGEIETVVLERDIIEIAETFARSAVIENEDGEKYGLIYLPEFYVNFDRSVDGRDVSDDVKKEILELKKEGIKGLIFDLRNNGGGSLPEVVEIVGLFIDKGPVVQVKSSDGSMRVLKDKDAGTIYDGNLVVLVNELSASASEIMAAALQDYKRAVVIGSPKTFGKGTVQTVLPLNRFSREDYGAIKMTIQKFYRVNGGSTQKNGVESDIVLPGRFTYADISEASQENALPWDQINEATYRPTNNIDYDFIKQKSVSRLQNNELFTLMDDRAKYVKSLEETDEISLNYNQFKTFMEGREKDSERFKALEDYKNNLKFSSLNYELEKIENDSILGIKRENWHKDLNGDFLLNESVQVLQDLNATPLLTDID